MLAQGIGVTWLTNHTMKAGFYPDLNRKEVRDWWGTQYSYLMDSGLEFVWQDMTTPAIHTSYGDMKG